jgi:hypothetical protein
MSLNSSFVPSDLVDWLHKRARFGESKDINSVDWSGVSGYDDFKDESYVKGVVYVFAVFVAVAFFTFLVSCLAACLACCKWCCYKDKRPPASLDDKGEDAHPRRCRRFSFLVLTLLIVACSLASMYVVSQVNGATGDTVEVMDDISDVVDRTLDLNDEVLAVLTLAQSNATELSTLDPVQGPPLLNSINAALDDVSDVSQSGDEFRRRLDDATNDSDDSRDDGDFYAWIYVCLVSLWAILTALVIVCCKKSSCVLRINILLGILLLWLLWVVTGVFFLLAILSADLCASPDNNIIAVAAAEPPYTSNTEAAASLYYIIGCAENNIPVTGVASLVDTTVVSFGDAEAELASVTPTVATQQYVDNIQSHFSAIGELLTGTDGMTTQVSCDTTNTLYARGRDNICDDLVDPLIQFFGLQAIASLLLFFAIMVAMPFWNVQKPRDAEANMRPVMSPQTGNAQAIKY